MKNRRTNSQRVLFLGIIVCMFAIAAPVFALDDVGFTIDNATGYTYDGTAVFTQSDKLSHWLTTGIGERLSFAYQLSYTFSLERYALFEIDLLRFGGTFVRSGTKPVVFRFNTGRFLFSEFSRAVFSHLADGFMVELGLPFAVFSLSAGYTGLVQGPGSTVILSTSDEAGLTVDPVPVLGPLSAPRLFGIVSARFPELFLRQTFDFAFLFQVDLRRTEKIVADRDRVHTQYYGIGFNGPIVMPLYYDAYFYLNTGQTAKGFVVGVLTGGGLTAYLQKALSSKASVGFMFASGDADHVTLYEGNTSGNSTAFIPVSATSTGFVVSPRLTNVFYPSAKYSIKPLSFIDKPAAQNFLIELKTFPFFRATPGPVSVSGIDDASDALYLGTEFDFTISARPLSDLGLGYSMGFFFPGAAVEEKTVRSMGRFDVSLSF